MTHGQADLRVKNLVSAIVLYLTGGHIDTLLRRKPNIFQTDDSISFTDWLRIWNTRNGSF